MSTYRNIILTFTLILAGGLSSCQNDLDSETHTTADSQTEGVAIQLGLQNLVSLTRGTDPSAQNDSFDPSTRIGLFIMLQDDYKALLNGESQHSPYHYDNIPCTVATDGTIQPQYDYRIIYPAHEEDSVAIFAYAPYNKDMKRDDLLFPKSQIEVSLDQNKNSTVLSEDFLLGTPVKGNPQRGAVTDDSSLPFKSEVIPLTFSHQRARITLDMKITASDSVLAAADTVPVDLLEADTISVYLQGPATAYPTGTTLNSTLNGFEVPIETLSDSLLMYQVTGITLYRGTCFTNKVTAITLPTIATDTVTFHIIIVTPCRRLHYYFTEHEGTAFLPGSHTLYNLNISTTPTRTETKS